MVRAPYFCRVKPFLPPLPIVLVWLVTLCCLTSCAMKVAPTGGPVDRTPTEVASTDPANGALNVSERTLTIRFTSYVDRGVRNAIVIQPKARFTSSYAGNEIEVTFEDELLPNTTYTVTLGTDWKDMRGNSPTQAMSVTFSTGPEIDTGAITGTVSGAELRNIKVLVYAGADTLGPAFNPMQRFATYVMPVGSAGVFTVAGLRDGAYRLVVVQDGNSNDLLDVNESYAMAISDIDIRQGARQRVELVLGPSLSKMRDDSIAAATPPDTTQRDTSARDTTKRSIEPGSIEGTFQDSLDLKGPYLLRFKEASGSVTAVVRVRSGESWRVEAIPPGTYSMDLVIDANRNDRYDHGMPFPYAFAERMVPISRSVTVRSRWTSEGVAVVVK